LVHKGIPDLETPFLLKCSSKTTTIPSNYSAANLCYGYLLHDVCSWSCLHSTRI